LADVKSKTNKNAKVASYTPSGRITVYDDIKGTIGVEGVMVRARRWFTIYTGYANEAGYYTCNGSFDKAANYSIDWERYNFAIRDGLLSGAFYNGPEKSGTWNVNLTSGAHRFYATIFRGAYRYYYKAINGLRRPPQNSVLGGQLHIRAFNEDNDNGIAGKHCAVCGFAGIGSDIKIYFPQMLSFQIFGTTIHELAHASHWNMDANGALGAVPIVKESYASGVDWSIGNLEYPGFYSVSYVDEYTGVVEDMIDATNDNNDQVSGYTIKQIEDALIGQKYWTSWRTNIENIHNNPTENNLGDLFDYWD
jgi:hypothetical protein